MELETVGNMNTKVCLQNNGIYNLIYKLNRNSDSSSIVIGIGGVGIKNLDEVKSCLCYETYEQVQFLAIDTDMHQFNQQYPRLNMTKEFFYIDSFNVGEKLMDLHRRGSLFHVDWLNPNVSILAQRVCEGTGGIRQVGKYLLSKKCLNCILN